MASLMTLLLKLLLVVGLFHSSSSADSLMGGHLDNKDQIDVDHEQSMARTRSTDLDLDSELESEDVPHPSALISDGLQFRMPGLFAFNGGKPFSLEKDPITGKIDFEKAPLKSLNYTAEIRSATDYDEYDEDSYVTDVQSDDIYDKKNIDRKDGSMDGTRPNEINPYSPSFHDFLNLPVHYSSGKYSKEKYPLISSSYANTKVQSGLNSYNTYNHRPYVDTDTTTRPPLYYTTHKTYLPKTTMSPTTILRPSSTWTTSPTTTTTTTTTTSTTTTTTPRPTTTTTTVPSTQKPTFATWKPTTYAPTKPSTSYSPTKPSTTKVPSTTQQSQDSYSDNDYGDSFASFKPMPDTNYNKKPGNSNIPLSPNSHARPVISSEYEDNYEYDSFEEDNNDESVDRTGFTPSTSTVSPVTESIKTSTMATATTVGKHQSSEVPIMGNNRPPYRQDGNNFTTNLGKKPTSGYTQTTFTGPPPTSLPLGDNHPERPFHPYIGNPLVLNRTQLVSGDNTNYRKPETAHNPVRFFDHPILNNVNPDLSINVNSRPYENGNGHLRPLNVNPNGMHQVESTSSVIIPPGQDTVSFVLGNQQNVDGGHFVGSAMRESPYVPKNEGSFQPYNSQNVEQRPPQTITIPKKQSTHVPVALASVAVNPKPIFVTEVGHNKPNLPNNIEQHTFNFNPQSVASYPLKINNVDRPNPNPLTSFVNPPPPYHDNVPNNPTTVLSGTASPVRFNVAHPQSGPSENSLNLGVRTSLNAPPQNIGSRPIQNEGVNIRNVPVEASLNLGVRPFSEGSTIIDRKQNQEDKNVMVNNDQNDNSGYVVFPGNDRDRPVEEHVIVINEADGSVQEFSPTVKGTPVVDRVQEHRDNLPELSESLTPPDKPIERPLERPSETYPPRPFDGRPRPYYPQRPDYLRPPRLPPHSKTGPSDGSYKRPPLDSKLPNILPQFRPNAKTSHGHHGSELIGTIPAPYGPGRQPLLGRRPPPQYLQRLSPPPPPPPHALRLVSDSEPGFRESIAKEGQKYQDPILINDRYQGYPNSDNQRYRDSLQFSNSASENERFQDSGSSHKRFRIPPSMNERFQGFPPTEGDQFSEQKLRRNDESQSEAADGFERFSADPPQIPSRPLINRRSSSDQRDAPQVTTLQMIQQQGNLDERIVKPNLPPPFRVNFDKDGDSLDDDDSANDDINDKDGKRPVYVVYPVNSAVNIKDDAPNEDESVVVGTRGPHRPLPPDTLPSVEDNDEEDGMALPLLRDRPLLRPQNRPFSNTPIKSDFPYPLERPDPSLLMRHEKPLLVPSDKIDEKENDGVDEEEDEGVKRHDDTSINLIPYLQDYMPFPMRKAETPALPPKSAVNSENPWPLGESDSRIIFKPADDNASIYRAPISVTLKTVPSTTVTPIAYAYTPTDDTPEYPKSGIRPSELIEVMPDRSKEDNSNQNPVLPSQQPSSSSSSAPSPQNFMAPFMASVSAEAPSSNGWNVVSKPETNDRSDVEENEEETQTEQSEFDIENFKPQLFGGFKPIYEFPMDNDSASKATEIPETKKDDN